MRRQYTPAFGSAWTLTAAATLLVAVMPAATRAQQGSGAPSAVAVAHNAAAGRFEALAKDAEAGRMPRLGDPGVVNLLDTLADAAGIYGTPKFPARLADLGVCLDVRKALVRYSLKGLWADLLPRAAAERIVIAS